MSFDEVYKKHYFELRRFGRQLNVSSELIEDLTQETFLRFYLEVKKEVVVENPRAWLYKVFLNLFRTSVSSNYRKFSDLEALGKTEVLNVDFVEEFSRNENQRIVMEMLTMMTKREREILLLYHNGFSYAEMAEILRINPHSVGKTVVRAIEKLKEALKIHYNEMFE